MSVLNVLYCNELSVEDFCILRKLVNWHEIPKKIVKKALEKSDFIVAAKVDDITVGMARLITDGTQVYVMDVAVHPDYQGKGIGRGLMERVRQFVESMEYDQMLAVLVTDRSNIGFYEKFEYADTVGMVLWLDRTE